MQGRLLTDIYGKTFDSNTIINKNTFDFIEGIKLDDLTKKEVASQIVFIPGKNNLNRVYFYSQLKQIFKANRCVRLPDPETREDLIEKLPEFKEVVTEFEKNAVNYNVSILEKYPHFVGLLKQYAEIILDKADTHRYMEANPDDIVANRRLEKEFYPSLRNFSPEEHAAFNSLFITNRKEYLNGNLIDFPTLWIRTDENAELYDDMVARPDGYKPYPHRNVILADAFAHTDDACMHSWGMDVLHLLLQYHHITGMEFSVFDRDENPYAHQMEQTLREHVAEEVLPPLQLEKGQEAFQLAAKLADPVFFLINDIIDKQKFFESDTWFDIAIWNRITDAKKLPDFMASLAASFEDFEGNYPSNRLVCDAFVNYRKLLENWPNISSWYELLIAEQKRQFINLIKSPMESEILTDLIMQIENSDTTTPLSDILKNDSLFLKVKYGKIVIKWLQTTKHDLLEWVSNSNKWIDAFNPLPHHDEADLKEKLAIREERLAMHTELIKDRQEYIKHGYGTHASDITKVINDVTNVIINSKDNIDHSVFDGIFSKKKATVTSYKQEEEVWADTNTAIMDDLLTLQQDYTKSRHRDDIKNLIKDMDLLADRGEGQRFLFIDIMNAIQSAYNFEKQNYTDSLFSIFRSLSFEERLQQKDDNYSYPRGLKKILDKYNVTLNTCKGLIEAEKFVPAATLSIKL